MSVVIDHPPSFINAFLQQKLGPDFGAIPMFPTVPTDMAGLAQEFTINDLTEGTVFSFNGNAAIYDRMFKMRRMPFPHIKCEQLLYYFNALEENAVPNLIRITQKIQDFLDRGDESAEDLNAWILSTFAIGDILDGDKKRPVATITGHGTFYVPHFHNFKIYQLEETRDIVDFGTARTYAGNKMIIDYDWHAVYSKNPS